MKLKVVVAIAFLVCVQASASAQAKHGDGTNNSIKAMGDYVRCQFNTEQENAWLQDPRLDAAKQAVRKVANSLDIKGQLGLDKQAALMQSIETAMSTRELQAAVEQSTQGESLKSARDQLTQAATKAISGMREPPTTPEDVACSQSILSYNETKDAFGTRVARTYVALQVVVRNLSPDNEFVLHDVQVAVPIRDEASHFRAGRDRLVARGVAIKGQSFDPRNFLMGGLDTLSATASAASTIASADFMTGSSIFTAFLSPLKHWLPDHTVDQLNRLNDLAFSASSSYKIIVPKNGSVPFVTFVPQELFEKSPRNWSRKEFSAWGNTTSVVVAGAHIQEVKNPNSQNTGTNTGR